MKDHRGSPRGSRRTAGSARRAGSSARAASPGSRTRRRAVRAAAAAGSAAPGSVHRDHRDQDRDRRRAPEDAARPGCTRSPCSSGSSTGTPRRTAPRPHAEYGTAGRARPRARRAPRRDAGGHPGRAAGANRAADSRSRPPGAAVEVAGARHRPCGDRRPRTSRRNPTGVRSGRSACRRFPLSCSGPRGPQIVQTACVLLVTACLSPRSRPSAYRSASLRVPLYFFTRTVFVDRVSRVISSASATFAFNRTVPAAASTTSTTFESSFAVSAFPEALAS